ncbi:VapB protein of antitoxin of type II toxin-antitoxin system [Prosthecobacter fusiformis]|uniref:VapB protein of antitoxin of type II toxin-antitoxin system n=1 Tax=Prosthecobacter fusiformis TaxID=48464 RepID=A0A4V3FER8_9BACT|nr:type II toxin-antitoxin system VapB family antitoxin [Prosthecobacter fusiformis]TDU68033.1 VapB protein of antitoxin of type II toxin-antitoxin system [Prosthecobacter fusiformis]
MKKQISSTHTEPPEEPETSRTNIVMETQLVNAAQEITGIKTKAGVVHYALKEVVRRSNMKELLSLHGKVDWDGDLNITRKNREF